MSEFSRLGKAGSHAVEMTNSSRTCRPEVKFAPRGGGLFCACDGLAKDLMRSTAQSVISKAGSTALVVLAGSYAGRAVAKTKHKNGEITCYTYRKIKDLVNAQPWFTIPLITIPVINNNTLHPWRPPFATYVLMVGGWMLNTSAHVLVVSTKEDRFKKYTVPASYLAWGLSILVATVGFFTRSKRACSC